MNAEELKEDDVIRYVAEYLRREGWTVHRALLVSQKGVDILAERGGSLLYAEAKGAVGTRSHLRLNEYQASTSALMQASAIRNLDAKAVVVIALPDTPEFRYHMTTIRTVLDLAAIDTWFISGAGVVCDSSDSMEPPAWPLKSLPQPHLG